MDSFVDTNVLIFCVQHASPNHADSLLAIRSVLSQGDAVFVLPQVIAEFWNVCTRPLEKNGLGLAVKETAQELRKLDRMLTMLYETPEIHSRWREMVEQYKVRGVQVHDARIAAAMEVHGVSRILTYNVRDFQRYAGITALRPEQALNA